MTGIKVYDRVAVDAAVLELKDSGALVYVATTGAGAGVNKMIWLEPGISSALVGFNFPYHPRLTDEFVGRSIEHDGYSYCSLQTALAMAHASYFKAQRVAALENKLDKPIVGVGLTAAVATNRTLRGGTRVYAAVRHDHGISSFHATLDQGRLGREADGDVCDLIALNMALDGACIPMAHFASFPEELGLQSHRFFGKQMAVVDCADSVYIETTPFHDVYLGMDGRPCELSVIDFSKTVIFPGSFRSFHFGHDAVANTVMKSTGRKVVFEITRDNVYKTATIDDLIARARQFVGRWSVILREGAGRFVDKAALYPGAHFVCGFDVAEKILEPEYYPEEGGLLGALARLRDSGTVFYVMDRADGSGAIKSRNDLLIPAGFERLFERLSDHWEISSTAIDKSRQA